MQPASIAHTFFNGNLVPVVCDTRLSVLLSGSVALHLTSVVNTSTGSHFLVFSPSPSPSIGCLVLGRDWVDSVVVACHGALRSFVMYLYFIHTTGTVNSVFPHTPSPVTLAGTSEPLPDTFTLQSDHVIPSISEASSSSSVSSLSPEVSVCSLPLDAVQVFYDNIVRARGVGIQSSCFSYDSNVLVHLMKLHGIHCRPDLSVDEQQYILLRHLVGNCFRSAEHNRSLPHGSCVDIVCGDLSSAFPSATDMSIAFVWHIVEDISTDQKLTNRKLSTLTAAFSRGFYSFLPFSPRTHAK